VKLPNAEQALVDVAKRQDYVLSPTHPRGRNKARVFRSALGLTASDADELRAVLPAAVLTTDAVPSGVNEFGRRYVIDFEMNRLGKSELIRSTWIVKNEDEFPRLTTCYVLS